MKTKYFILILVAIFAATLGVEAQSKNEQNKKTVVFNVSMHCESCQKKVEKNVAFEKGVKDMKVNLENKTVIVTFDTKKTNEANLIKAFEKLGYEATVVPAVSKRN